MNVFLTFFYPFFILGNKKCVQWKSLTNKNMHYPQISFSRFGIGSMFMTLASGYTEFTYSFFVLSVFNMFRMCETTELIFLQNAVRCLSGWIL